MNTPESVYMDEARAHFRTRLELHRYKDALRNLMAVINRDGGHRAGHFSDDMEAAEDCENTIRKIYFDTKVTDGNPV